MNLPTVPQKDTAAAFRLFEQIATKYDVPRDELVELVGAAQATEWHVGFYAGYQAGRREATAKPEPTIDDVADSVFELFAKTTSATDSVVDLFASTTNAADREAEEELRRAPEERRKAACAHVWPDELDSEAECLEGCGATYGLWSQ